MCSSATFEEEANPHEIILYRYVNYGGTIKKISLENYSTTSLGYSTTDRNLLSSFKIGKGVKATFTRQNNCGDETDFGTSLQFVGPYNLPSFDDFDSDKFRATFEKYDENNIEEAVVSIFGKKNFKIPFGGIFKKGKYTSDQLVENHIGTPGNMYPARSIRVPEGLSVRLFTEDNFLGESLTIEGPASLNLAD